MTLNIYDKFDFGERLEIGERRIAICESCDRYIKIVATCTECGCIMPLKTKIKGSWCPIGKWESEE